MKFKVGDKVKVKKKYQGLFSFLKKEILTIERIASSEIINVRTNEGKLFGFQEKWLKDAFSWKIFKKGKFAVHCKTEEEAEDFFKKLAKHIYHWNDGEEIKSEKTEWEVYKSATCYVCNFHGFNGLNYSERGFYKHEGYRIVEWSDYMNNKSVSEESTKDLFKLEYLKRLKAGGYNWIVRNNTSRVYAFIEKPVKETWIWKSKIGVEARVNRIIVDFPEVQWEDKEPTHINDLIKIYEKE